MFNTENCYDHIVLVTESLPEGLRQALTMARHQAQDAKSSKTGILGVNHHAQLSEIFSSYDVLVQINPAFFPFFLKFRIGFLSYENKAKGLTL